MSNQQIKEILEEVYPVESMSVGETAIDYLLEDKVHFSHDSTDSGANIDLAGYISIISGSIVILKEGYEFIKILSKDLRKRITPEEVLSQIDDKNELSASEKKQLIRKVITLLEDD